LGGFVAFILIGRASAATFDENRAHCLEKFANPQDAALVMLECSAADGKVSNCKVLDNDKPNKGFDKAAVCVAESLPMGARVGVVKIPVRFPGAG
jgi:hypothetical protein